VKGNGAGGAGGKRAGAPEGREEGAPRGTGTDSALALAVVLRWGT